MARRNSTFQVLQALKTNRAKRNELGEAFVEGVAAIKSAVRAGRPLRRLVCEDGRELSGWARDLLASTPGAQVLALDPALYRELSDRDEPSELLATVAKERLAPGDVPLPADPLVVVVDRPSNHGNLGSLVRSADAFGVDLVVTLGHGVDPWDPAVIRASLGGVFGVALCHEPSPRALGAWIARVRAACPALAVIGTDSAADRDLADAPAAARPLVLVVGNEARGLSVELRSLVDGMVRIPMRGSVDSLNVACAASIVLYEVSRRRVRRP